MKAILDIVLDVLQSEAQALRDAAASLTEHNVTEAVELIDRCRGTLIIIGVGKSGIVAMKLAATFRSLGVPSVFLHPAEALHGDLGVVTSNDLCIIISHSGETPEIVDLLPHIRERGLSIISLIGNPRSALARFSAIVLSTHIAREACPLNLAPTASTTVAMAMGDALAVAVMVRRGIQESDFARNHPGGRLGKRLGMRVGDLMHCGDRNPLVLSSASWADVLKELCAKALGAVNVVDEHSRLVGIITDGDIRRTVTNAGSKAISHLANLTAGDLMTTKPKVSYPEVLAYEALQKMEGGQTQISVLPIIDAADSRCVGLLRLHDIVNAGL